MGFVPVAIIVSVLFVLLGYRSFGIFVVAVFRFSGSKPVASTLTNALPVHGLKSTVTTVYNYISVFITNGVSAEFRQFSSFYAVPSVSIHFRSLFLPSPSPVLFLPPLLPVYLLLTLPFPPFRPRACLRRRFGDGVLSDGSLDSGVWPRAQILEIHYAIWFILMIFLDEPAAVQFHLRERNFLVSAEGAI